MKISLEQKQHYLIHSNRTPFKWHAILVFAQQLFIIFIWHQSKKSKVVTYFRLFLAEDEIKL